MEGSEEGRKEEIWRAFDVTRPCRIAIPDRLCRLNLGTVSHRVLTEEDYAGEERDQVVLGSGCMAESRSRRLQ